MRWPMMHLPLSFDTIGIRILQYLLDSLYVHAFRKRGRCSAWDATFSDTYTMPSLQAVRVVSRDGSAASTAD